MVGNPTEQGRQRKRTDICRRHLHADHSLRMRSTKMRRRRMDDTRINRRTSESDHDDPASVSIVGSGSRHRQIPMPIRTSPMRIILASENFSVAKPLIPRPTVMPIKNRLAKRAAVTGSMPFSVTRKLDAQRLTVCSTPL